MRYRKNKVKETIKFLISNDYEITYREVIQYLYLIDAYYYKHMHKSYTNDIYIKTNEGIMLKQTLYHLYHTYRFKLRKVYTNKLTRNEKVIIQQIINTYRSLTKNKYIEMCKIEKDDMLITIRDIFLFWDKSIEEIKELKYNNRRRLIES
jgi:hypothetical protein